MVFGFRRMIFITSVSLIKQCKIIGVGKSLGFFLWGHASQSLVLLKLTNQRLNNKCT